MRFCVVVVLICVLSSCASAPQEDTVRAAHLNMQLGLGYLEIGQFERAKEKLLLALQEAPKSAPVCMAMGQYFLARKDIARAKYYYDRAIHLAPREPSVQNNYGVFLCKTGHAQEALSYLQQASQNTTYLHAHRAAQNLALCDKAFVHSSFTQGS